MANKRKVCANCAEPKNVSQFYATENIDIYPDGRIHLCKVCCQDIFDKEEFSGFQKIMKLIDKPIYDDLYKGNYGDYIRQINSLGQYKGLSYEATTLFEEAKKTSIKKIKPTTFTEEELENCINFFGEGFTEQDYIFLDREYINWASSYKVEDSKGMEEIVKQICLTQLDINNKRLDGKSVEKELKLLQELMETAGIKPKQEKSTQGSDQLTYGQWIKRIEDERPISEPDPRWKDVDGIRKYVITFFLGNMAKMFGKENPYQTEYEEEIEKYTVRPEKDDD